MSGVMTGSAVLSAADEAVTDGALIDVSGYCLDELLAVLCKEAAESRFATALSRVLTTESNCANSFQSSI
jgi:hypothetical protein